MSITKFKHKRARMLKMGKEKKSDRLQTMKVLTQYKLVPVIICSQLVIMVLLYRNIINVLIKLPL